MEIKVKIRNLKIKMILMMISLITMDSSIAGRDAEILLKLDLYLGMILIMMWVLTSIRRREHMLVHILHLATLLHSGMRIISCRDHILQFQEMSIIS